MTSETEQSFDWPNPVIKVNTAKSPVVAYVSQRILDDPTVQTKLHLNVACSGLERSTIHPVESKTLAIAEFYSLYTLARYPQARPCRMCALEPVLDRVLRPTRGNRSVFASFTSQANPNEGLRNYKWGSAQGHDKVISSG